AIRVGCLIFTFFHKDLSATQGTLPGSVPSGLQSGRVLRRSRRLQNRFDPHLALGGDYRTPTK
ncbi:MAG: hypothetical protein ACSHX7_14580, partial [Luteolibacter sp.]